MKETKRERFIRLVEKRTNTVLDKLRILGGCANRRMYEYTQADINKIKSAIYEEIDHVFEKFEDQYVEFSLESKEK